MVADNLVVQMSNLSNKKLMFQELYFLFFVSYLYYFCYFSALVALPVTFAYMRSCVAIWTESFG